MRIERDFEPELVRRFKASSARDLVLGGSNSVAQFLIEDLVDQCHLIVFPILIGGRKPAFRSGANVELELLGTHRFDNGVVQLHHSVHNWLRVSVNGPHPGICRWLPNLSPQGKVERRFWNFCVLQICSRISEVMVHRGVWSLAVCDDRRTRSVSLMFERSISVGADRIFIVNPDSWDQVADALGGTIFGL